MANKKKKRNKSRKKKKQSIVYRHNYTSNSKSNSRSNSKSNSKSSSKSISSRKIKAATKIQKAYTKKLRNKAALILQNQTRKMLKKQMKSKSIQSLNSTSSSSSNKLDKCAICLENISPEDKSELCCNVCHPYHKNCMTNWILNDNYTCPTCRQNINFDLGSKTKFKNMIEILKKKLYRVTEEDLNVFSQVLSNFIEEYHDLVDEEFIDNCNRAVTTISNILELYKPKTLSLLLKSVGFERAEMHISQSIYVILLTVKDADTIAEQINNSENN